MDFLITGGNGLLGSHLIAHLLQQRPETRIACLVRADDGAMAEQRLSRALELAITDASLALTARDLMSRIVVLRGDLIDSRWVQTPELQAWLNPHEPLHIFHSAANISFSKDDRTSIWKTNVEGTRSLLAASLSLPNVASFNYVSTAYVAGKRDGLILEADQSPPPGFHNTYEESKWTAEQLVRRNQSEHSIPCRIFRPSIIIGNSNTHRISNYSGFYNVIDKLWHLTRMAKASDFPLRLPFDPAATLDLMPIDIVVKEILFLLELGAATTSRTFHITNESPLTLPDIIFALSTMTGVAVSYTQPAEREASGLGGLIGRALRHYAPYLSQVRSFDRHDVQAFGAGCFQASYRLDMSELQRFVAVFLKERIRRTTATA